MVSSEDVFEAFIDLGYILEDPVIDRLWSFCVKYNIDEKTLSSEYSTFAAKKKYQDPNFDILELFEKEVFYTTKKSSTKTDKEIAANKGTPTKKWCIGVLVEFSVNLMAKNMR